jgi:hypothetical protein
MDGWIITELINIDRPASRKPHLLRRGQGKLSEIDIFLTVPYLLPF